MNYYKKMLELQKRVFQATLSNNIFDLEKYWNSCDKSKFNPSDDIVKVLEFNGLVSFKDFENV